MYIPIGPSKKQLYKIIIALLLLFYLIFLGMYKPKALTTSEFTNNGTWIDTSIDVGNNSTSVRFLTTTGAKNIFTGLGEGYVLFTFQTSSYSTNVTSQLTEVNAIASNGTNVCEIGTTNGYLDSQNQIITWTAKCPVNLSGNNNLIRISWTRGGPSGKLDIRLGSVIGFVSKDSASNTSVIEADLSTIQQYQIDIQGNITSFKNLTHQDLEAIKNALANNNTTIQNIQNNTQNISDSINDSSIDSSSANDLTSNSAFQDSNGLDAIIKAPLNFIQSLTSSTCSAINLTIPYIEAEVSLPCMSTIYNKALGQQLVNLIALVINGVVLYRYCLKILQLVHNAKNPNKDELEVLDL